MKNILRRFLPLLLLLALGAGIYFGYKYYNDTYKEKLACNFQPFVKVKNGMDSETVFSLLGEPDTKVIKDQLGGNGFGQGDLELQIKSGWLYALPEWGGGLEVYFDSSEIVVGKNCGNG